MTATTGFWPWTAPWTYLGPAPSSWTCLVAFRRCNPFKAPSGPRHVGLDQHLSTSVRHLAENVRGPGQLRIQLAWCDLHAVRPGPNKTIDVLL